MQMSRKLFVCLTLSLLDPACGRPRRTRSGSGGGRTSEFTRELALTPDQMRTHRRGLPGGVAGAAGAAARPVEARGRAVEDGRAKARVEEPEVEHFVGKVEAARADLGKTRTMMIFRIRRILTPDQHVKLRQLFDQNEKERRGKGHGE